MEYTKEQDLLGIKQSELRQMEVNLVNDGEKKILKESNESEEKLANSKTEENI